MIFLSSALILKNLSPLKLQGLGTQRPKEEKAVVISEPAAQGALFQCNWRQTAQESVISMVRDHSSCKAENRYQQHS